jgi:DNA mismatch repair protein MutL
MPGRAQAGTPWALRQANLFEKPGNEGDYAFPGARTVPGVASPTATEFYIPDEFLKTAGQKNAQRKLAQARFIGAFISKYLLFEAENSLLLVDQHAAQERIFYEQFIQQLDKGTVEVQHLLSPVVIKLSPQERLVLDGMKDEFDAMGLSISMFDEETLAVHSHPTLVKDIEKAVRGVLSGGKVNRFDHDTIARRACRSSIMTGDKLSKEQAEHQRDQLMKCLDPFTCPHGRPIVVELTEAFLDKQFLRT